MRSHSSEVPKRFPVGTRYVVEGSRSSRGELRVRSRYLEFPDGTHLDLPVRGLGRTNARRRPAGRRRRK